MNRSLTAPGSTAEVHADRALVLAPHPDDEVLGCGGLAARLAASGGVVRVLWLSDGGGNAVGEARAERTALRRQEAEAAAKVLGLVAGRHLALPDGRLAHHREEITKALAEELSEGRPEIVLVPSPLESSVDHRATFRALHHLLAGLRPGDALWSSVEGVRVLTYEVNHPQYPDLLVPVDDQLGLLRQAMDCHRSQQEEHDYLGARLGLARFRTLTLPPGVEHVEAYRQLTLEDFTTRGPAALVRELGGEPELLRVKEGPRLSVIVRTKDRPGLLAEALASLAASTYRRAEVVVVNDGGAHPELPEDFPLELRRLDLEQNRGRAAAANAGIEIATGDYIAFLDDDDLVEPEHLETLAGLVDGELVRVAYTDAAVTVHTLGPSGYQLEERRLPYSRDFDRDLLFFDNYIPFNTVLIHRELALEVGPLDTVLPFFEDWDFLLRLAGRTAFHHLARVTCEYRQFRGAEHHILGDEPRRRADFLDRKAQVISRHAAAWGPETISRVVDRLRREAIEEQEEVRRLVDELRGFYGLNGRLESAERHAAVLEAVEERTRAELRSVAARKEQLDAELGATYGEIERLTALVREMESTRAFRLHRWWQRVKPWGSTP
jgi:LmbE family N-acetylglucosaminyl deacetylase